MGVTRFELVTSSVSGKRSPPEPNARFYREQQGYFISFRSLCQPLFLKNLANFFFGGGDARIRTGGEGFAGLCLTTWPRRHFPEKEPAVKTGSLFTWSGQRGSNPRPQPWQGCALPAEPCPRCLNYITHMPLLMQVLFFKNCHLFFELHEIALHLRIRRGAISFLRRSENELFGPKGLQPVFISSEHQCFRCGIFIGMALGSSHAFASMPLFGTSLLTRSAMTLGSQPNSTTVEPDTIQEGGSSLQDRGLQDRKHLDGCCHPMGQSRFRNNPRMLPKRIRQRKRAFSGPFKIRWCRRRDLNPHARYMGTSTSS